MLIMSADQVQLTAMDYAQILGKWFARGQAFALAQEATAKKFWMRRESHSSVCW